MEYQHREEEGSGWTWDNFEWPKGGEMGYFPPRMHRTQRHRCWCCSEK